MTNHWQFDGMKSSQGHDTVCKSCSSSAWLMRNRCYESLSNTVKLRLLSESRGWRGDSCLGDSPVSHRQKAEQSWVVSTLALRLLHVNLHCLWQWVILYGRDPFEQFCAMCRGKSWGAWKGGVHWKRTTWREKRKAGDLFLAQQHNITCHTALSCCFHLKLLHLAPNLCWEYTMKYPYSFDAQRNDTHKQKTNKTNKPKKSHRDEITFEFFFWNEPSSFFLFTIMHKRTKPTKV